MSRVMDRVQWRAALWVWLVCVPPAAAYTLVSHTRQPEACETHQADIRGTTLKQVTHIRDGKSDLFLRPLPGFQRGLVMLQLRSTAVPNLYLAGQASLLPPHPPNRWHNLTLQHTTHNSKHSARITVDGVQVPFESSNKTFYTTAYAFDEFMVMAAGKVDWSLCFPPLDDDSSPLKSYASAPPSASLRYLLGISIILVIGQI